MKAGLSTLTVLAACGAASAAIAAPCTADTVAGVWSLVSVRAAEPGVEAFYAQAPNEWMRFDPDGGYTYVASTRPKTRLAEIQSSLNEADRMDGVTYRIDWLEAGRMLIRRNDQPFQIFRCEILERAASDARAGDLILSADAGMPMLRRVQRRVTR
ncbi:MAG: hypothetical protein EON90_13855 [Brevundimonas sp.]|nr:MAG: hypothetical protein EON90_13855 [Brevundimonas sp.]